jgi:hypothetical protein
MNKLIFAVMYFKWNIGLWYFPASRVYFPNIAKILYSYNW